MSFVWNMWKDCLKPDSGIWTLLCQRTLKCRRYKKMEGTVLILVTEIDKSLFRDDDD